MPKKKLRRVREKTEYTTDMIWRMVIVMLLTAAMVIVLAIVVFQAYRHSQYVFKFSAYTDTKGGTWKVYDRNNNLSQRRWKVKEIARKTELNKPGRRSNLVVLQWAADKISSIFENRDLETKWLCGNTRKLGMPNAFNSFMKDSAWYGLQDFLAEKSAPGVTDTLNAYVCQRNGKVHSVVKFPIIVSAPRISEGSSGINSYYWVIKIPLKLELLRNDDFNPSSLTLNKMATVVVQRENEAEYPSGFAFERIVIV
jgi:hypothetical protein